MQSLSTLLDFIYRLLHADENIVESMEQLEFHHTLAMQYVTCELPINNVDGVKEAALMSMGVWDILNLISTLRNSFCEEIVCVLISALTCIYYKTHDRRCYYQEIWRTQEPSLFSLPVLIKWSEFSNSRFEIPEVNSLLTINSKLTEYVENANNIHVHNDDTTFINNAKHVAMCLFQQQQYQQQSVSDEAPLIHPRVMQFLLAQRRNIISKEMKFTLSEHNESALADMVNGNDELSQLSTNHSPTLVNYFGDEITRHADDQQKYITDIRSECMFDGCSSTSRDYDRLTLFCRSNMISIRTWRRPSNVRVKEGSNEESIINLLFNRKRDRFGKLIEPVSLLPVKAQLSTVLSSVHTSHSTVLERLFASK